MYVRWKRLSLSWRDVILFFLSLVEAGGAKVFSWEMGADVAGGDRFGERGGWVGALAVPLVSVVMRGGGNGDEIRGGDYFSRDQPS